MSQNVTWTRPISTWWWLRKRTYFVFVMRELSSLFVAWFVLFLLLLIRAVSRGRRSTKTSWTGPRPPWSS